MHVLNIRNVNQALPAGIEYLLREGQRRDSRNGAVLVAPGPVTTVYNQPRERVLFNGERDANPFFHLMESLWMLAGRNDIAFLTRYVKRMRQFSDDGKTQHGAYGYRWLHHFVLVHDEGSAETVHVSEINQLATIRNMLERNPDERRCVLAMWDPSVDLGRNGKDIPCNTHAYLSRGVGGELNMTVSCRSNDIIWGAYGANAVHFSVLLEFMAAAIGCEVGRYWQMSNNFHGYLSTLDPLAHLADRAPDPLRTAPSCPYESGQAVVHPLVSTPWEQWLQDMTMFLEEGVVIGLRDPFFRRVAVPLEMAHRAFKENSGDAKYEKPLEILSRMADCDWKLACEAWLLRRQKRAQEKAAGHEMR